VSGARLCEIKPAASDWLLLELERSTTVRNQAPDGGIQRALAPRAGRAEINRRLLVGEETIRLYRDLVLVCSPAAACAAVAV